MNNKKYKIQYGKDIFFQQIYENIKNKEIRTRFDYCLSDRRIKPNGGYLYLEEEANKNVKFILLIAEMKRQGTNDERKNEGKKQQAIGNAIERLGKDLTGIRAMFNHELITPFVCFGYGCDFDQGKKTMQSKLSTLNEFYPINEIYVWKRDSSKKYNAFSPVTMYFREQPWTEEEIFEILKKIAETALGYYIY